jgi:hypothetical protein
MQQRSSTAVVSLRRIYAALVAFALSILMVSAVSAQIQIVPGQPVPVDRSPKYITTADFNGDGIADAAVTNTGSSHYTMLRGCPPSLPNCSSGFSDQVTGPVGMLADTIVAADLNNDGKPDLAVLNAFTDTLRNDIFIAPGQGDGTFSQPIGFDAPFLPVDMAIGNFDNPNRSDSKNNLDLVLASRVGVGSQKVLVLLSLSGNFRGFQTARVFTVGRSPVRVLAVDVNQDGYDDIVTIDSGTTPTDDVAVLINKAQPGVVDFNFPDFFVVGVGAVDAAVSDFNRDGAPDLLVLNTGAVQVQNTFAVSVLLNKRDPVTGKGTGIFTHATDVPVNCPAQISGVPIYCNPKFITTGDYDGDGNQDFAVSFQTSPQTPGNPPTAGIVNVYAGHGDGTFDLGPQLLVATNPGQMATADFTGDGIDDIALAETGTSSVRLLVSIPPPTPTTTATPTRTRTFTPTLTATLTPTFTPTPQPNGRPCSDGPQCQSGFCVDGVCCATQCIHPNRCDEPISTLPGNGLCNSVGPGVCHPPLDNGCSCVHDTDCLSGNCDHGSCGLLRTPTPTATPTKSGPGGSCQTGSQCLSGLFCTNGVCCTVSACLQGQVCSTDGQCHTEHGGSCQHNSECIIGDFCTDTVCCSTPDCPSGERCDIFEFEGDCNQQGTVGTECNKNIDCMPLLLCQFDEDLNKYTCQSQPTPSPTIKFPTPTPPPPTPITRCVGDCDASGHVTVAEIILCVNIALGKEPLSRCPVCDRDRSGDITVDELVAGVRNALDGCAS